MLIMSRIGLGLGLAATVILSACGSSERVPTTPVPATALTGSEPTRIADQTITPTGLHVSSTGRDFLEFAWNPVPTASSYQIQISTNEVFTDADSIFSVDAISGQNPWYRVEGVSLGSTLHARVRSLQGRTISLWSTHVTGMTAVPPSTSPTSDGLGSFNIYGLVVTGDGVHDYTRIQDALVGVTNLSTMEIEDLALTDPLGFYEFKSLQGARYRVDVAALGYLPTRPLYARSRTDSDAAQLDFWLVPDELSPAVDRRRFRRSFWDEIGFDAYECPDPDDCPDYWQTEEGDLLAIAPLLDRLLFVLPTTSPNFHIRTHNDQRERRLSSSWVRRFREAIPAIVSDLTGEHYVGEITSGPNDVDRPSWITIQASTEAEAPDMWKGGDDRYICGRARVGAIHGQIWLNYDRMGLSATRTKCGWRSVLAHEIGHAFGFFHVSGQTDVMAVGVDAERFSRNEKYHAELAYAYGRFTPYFAGPQTLATSAPEPPASPIITCHIRP